jgi:hypothetical protein
MGTRLALHHELWTGAYLRDRRLVFEQVTALAAYRVLLEKRTVAQLGLSGTRKSMAVFI